MAHVHLNRQQNWSNHWLGHPKGVRAACYKCRVKLDRSLIHDRLAFNHCRWPDIQQKLASRDHFTALEDLEDFVDYDKTPIQPYELQAAKAASALWTDKLPYFKLEEDLTAEERAQCKDVYGVNPLQELYFIHFRAMATPVNNSRRPGKAMITFVNDLKDQQSMDHIKHDPQAVARNIQGAASPVNLLRLIQTLCWKPALVEQRFDNGDVITNKNHVVQGKLARARLRATATIGFGTMRRKIESAYSVIQRRPNVRFTVPAFFKDATLAGQSIEAPPLPGDVNADGKAGVAQQNALSLVFMILNSKATQKGELHFNVLLEHVDVSNTRRQRPENAKHNEPGVHYHEMQPGQFGDQFGSLVKQTKEIFSDFHTDKNTHVMRKSGVHQAKNMAKMAGAKDIHSYFVLRSLLDVPKELMELGPVIKSDELLRQVQKRLKDPNTRDVTGKVQLRELFGREMRGAFWRGWAELLWHVDNNSGPGQSYHNHHEELQPELNELLKKHPRGWELLFRMVAQFDGLIRSEKYGGMQAVQPLATPQQEDDNTLERHLEVVSSLDKILDVVNKHRQETAEGFQQDEPPRKQLCLSSPFPATMPMLAVESSSTNPPSVMESQQEEEGPPPSGDTKLQSQEIPTQDQQPFLRNMPANLQSAWEVWVKEVKPYEELRQQKRIRPYRISQAQKQMNSRFTVLGEEMERRVEVLGKDKGLESLAQFAANRAINALCENLKVFRLISKKGDAKPAVGRYPKLNNFIVCVTLMDSQPIQNIKDIVAAAQKEVMHGFVANKGLAARLVKVFEGVDQELDTTATIKPAVESWLQGCLVPNTQ
eukprot:jgi/Astpho2/8547/fgenesh1_pg.00125_%23_43_t